MDTNREQAIKNIHMRILQNSFYGNMINPIYGRLPLPKEEDIFIVDWAYPKTDEKKTEK